MYQVLYRKWRPSTFSDVVGQPQVTKTLLSELQSGRVAHAYLFTGSRGTGKTSCAKILAKAVNCLQSAEGNPCGECDLCRSIDSGSILDVVELDAASNNGVDNIRELCEEANFTPAVAKYRVYIIDEVHMLSPGAFNALLKTLEEPPEHVIFILATTEIHKLPATILSRCQRFDFRRIPAADISDRLLFISGEEKVTLEPEAALLIARLADGGMRDALSILDQCLSRNDHVTEDEVTEVAGIAGKDHLYELSECIEAGQPARGMDLVSRLHAASKDMARLCEELISHFRNLLLIKIAEKPRDMIVATAAEYERAQGIAGKFTLARLIEILDRLQEALGKMFYGGNRRIQMEIVLLRLCSPEMNTSVESLEKRINELEARLKRGEFSPSSPLPRAKPARPTVPPPAEVVDESLIQQAKLMDNWAEVTKSLAAYSPTLASFLHSSTAYLAGDYVLIDAPDSAFKLLRESAQKDSVREAIQKVTGKTYRLGPYRTPEKGQKNEEDPVSMLIHSAEEAGIDVKKD